MYAVADTLPVGRLDPGAFLLAGPAMTGKYDLLVSFAAEGIGDGDAVLVVTTNQDADTVVADVESRLGRAPSNLGVVDCVSEEPVSGGGPAADHVEYVSSPADLTGIGIGVSEQLRRFADDDAVTGTRIAFDSLSTLLMYADVETVFRFLHVLTGRVDAIDGLGVFTIDPTTHDERTVNTLKQAFDGLIELRGEGDRAEVRLLGVPDVPGEWTPRP